MPGMWGQAKIDDDRQREKRDAILVPGFYQLFFPGRFHRAVPTWPKREPFCCPRGG